MTGTARWRRYIGDKRFYAMVIAVVLPIVVQNAITNFVSLLDNIMVGATGTASMSGVSIANQILFVFNISIFGAISGAGIFGAQFFGAGNHQGVRDCFRFKLLVGMAITLLAMAIFVFWGEALIGKYLLGEAEAAEAEAAQEYGMRYLWVMLAGMIPYTISQIYAASLRETGNTRLPMLAGTAAVLVNVLFNYLLIFGHFGFPEMGIVGAAIATVISRFVEMGIIMTFTHVQSEKHLFIRGAYRSLRIPGPLAKAIAIKGAPLMLNELLWSLGMAMLAQNYSMRGLSVVAAMNISGTVANLFNAVFLSIGNAAAILVGQSLGADLPEEAKDRARKILTFSVGCCVVMGSLMALAAPSIPKIYNTSDSVRQLATKLIWVCAASMPVHAFAHCCYFTLRAGGKTIITFLFDSAFTWVVSIPLAYSLVHFTSMPIVPLYAICLFVDIFKCLIGAVMLKKGIWIHNIVSKMET